MQCSAWRPTSSASTCGAAAVEQHEVELLRPVVRRARRSTATCTGSSARPSRSAAAAAGTPRGRCHAGSTFSIPISVTSTFGSVRHMRPLPSDSTTPIVPGLGDPEVRARHRDRHGQELRAQVQPRRLGDRRGLVAERSWPCAIVRSNSARISARLRWIAGTRMCDCLSPGSSWTISSARSVSIAWMPCGLERLVEADLVRRQRLDLDHLVGAVRAWRSTRRSRSPRRRRAPSARRRRRA